MSNHIIGKVYDLTQENFNKVIRELESVKAENENLKTALNIQKQVCDAINDNGQQAFNLQSQLTAERKASNRLVEVLERFCDEEGYSIAETSGHYLGQALSEYKKARGENEPK